MNAFDILGLPMGADADAVNRRFREIARKIHPDKVGPEFEGLFKHLTEIRDIALGKRAAIPEPPAAEPAPSPTRNAVWEAMNAAMVAHGDSLRQAAAEQLGQVAGTFVESVFKGRGKTRGA